MVWFRPRLSERCKSPRCITAGMMDGCDRLEHAFVSPRKEARKEDVSIFYCRLSWVHLCWLRCTEPSVSVRKLEGE